MQQPDLPTRPDAMVLLSAPPSFGAAMENLRRHAGLAIGDAAEGITRPRTVRRIERLAPNATRSDLLVIDQLVRVYAETLGRDHREIWDALLDVLDTPADTRSGLWD